MIKFSDSTKLDPRTEERVRRIVDLSHRRDRILEASKMDLEALAVLAADYEAANMPCAAAELRKRLSWYRQKVMKGGDGVKMISESRTSTVYISGVRACVDNVWEKDPVEA